jgi:hypothetical protein
MGQREVFLLLLLSSASFALIDPPVDAVYQHDVAAASDLGGILGQNLLNCTERLPDIDDPTSFFCVKVLTLTPSVNYTVTAALHPKLIWAIAENNGQTFRTNWTADPDCSESWMQRTYGDAVLENATARFSVDGLLGVEGGNYTYMTANASEDMLSPDPLTNISTQLSIIDVPFKEPLVSPCSIVDLVSQFVLGGFFDLNCYEPTLDRASPYATGVYNLTVRNQTIIIPHLNVTIDAEIGISYRDEGENCYKDNGECTCDPISDEGNATFSASDSASYEVQNSYMTFIPYMPAFLNYSANTSEDAAFHFSVFSNSELYKYYFVMDNQTATAYYLYDFVVQNDSTGIETIIAVPKGTVGIIPGDPGALESYSGSHLIFLNISGDALLEPYQMNNLSYNYSRVYDVMEIFSNLSAGPHHADLEFFTFFGNDTVPYNISVRARTSLMIGAGKGSDNYSVDVNCLLTSRGLPLSGQAVELSVGNQTQTAVTDSQGMCPVETFQAAARIGTAYGEFEGTPELLPTDNYANYVLGSPFSFGADLIGNNFALLLLLSLLFAFSAMELLGFLSTGTVAGGATMGMVMDKFYPYRPDLGKAIATGINSYTKQVSKNLAKGAVAVAAAVATVATMGVAAPAAGAAAAGAGGATAGVSGAGAGGGATSAAAHMATKEAAKKVAEKAAQKAMEDKMKKEMMENAAKKDIKDRLKGKMKKKANEKLTKKKRMGIFGAAGAEDPEDKKKKMLEALRNHIRSQLSNIYGKAKTACENLGHPEWMSQFREKTITFHDFTGADKTYRLKIGEVDCQVVEKLKSPDDYAVTLIKHDGCELKFLISIREDRAGNLSTLLPDANHEVLHTRNKLDEGRNENKVEGVNEIMSYEDSIKKLTTIEAEERKKLLGLAEPAGIKAEKLSQLHERYEQFRNEVCIAPGAYRDYAAPQYLLKHIIGEDNFNAGYLVVGEDYLRNAFDNVAGKGEYEKIFGVQKDKVTGNWFDVMGDKEKIAVLQDTFEKKVANTADEIDFVKTNVDDIKNYGRYKIKRD